MCAGGLVDPLQQPTEGKSTKQAVCHAALNGTENFLLLEIG